MPEAYTAFLTTIVPALGHLMTLYSRFDFLWDLRFEHVAGEGGSSTLLPNLAIRLRMPDGEISDASIHAAPHYTDDAMMTRAFVANLFSALLSGWCKHMANRCPKASQEGTRMANILYELLVTDVYAVKRDFGPAYVTLDGGDRADVYVTSTLLSVTDARLNLGDNNDQHTVDFLDGARKNLLQQELTEFLNRDGEEES
jgi:hypothetical protein